MRIPGGDGKFVEPPFEHAVPESDLGFPGQLGDPVAQFVDGNADGAGNVPGPVLVHRAHIHYHHLARLSAGNLGSNAKSRATSAPANR